MERYLEAIRNELDQKFHSSDGELFTRFSLSDLKAYQALRNYRELLTQAEIDWLLEFRSPRDYRPDYLTDLDLLCITGGFLDSELQESIVQGFAKTGYVHSAGFDSHYLSAVATCMSPERAKFLVQQYATDIAKVIKKPSSWIRVTPVVAWFSPEMKRSILEVASAEFPELISLIPLPVISLTGKQIVEGGFQGDNNVLQIVRAVPEILNDTQISEFMSALDASVEKLRSDASLLTKVRLYRAAFAISTVKGSRAEPETVGKLARDQQPIKRRGL